MEVRYDIQSATAEIRRGKRKKKKSLDENIMSASATQSGHNTSNAEDSLSEREPRMAGAMSC